MKGDFTRMTFRQDKHYTRVLKQQGRVDLDADWNEQNEICTRLDRTTRRDVIGRTGVPRDKSGFQVAADGDGNLTFSPGRMYVDGILCEQYGNAPIRLDEQFTFAPGYTPPAGPGPFLVYLDVWERHVTHIEDSNIREAALGGPDTATRVQTVFQVKLHPLPAGAGEVLPECQPFPAPAADGVLRAQTDDPDRPDNPCVVGAEGGYRGRENRLYRVEIHDGSFDENGEPAAQVTFKWSRDNGSVVTPVAPDGFDGNTVTVLHTGKDHVLSFRPGDRVEVSNEVRTLSNKPGMLTRVQPGGVKHGAGLPQLVFDDDVSAIEEVRAPIVRRWDHQESDAIALVNGALPISDDWIELEDGIQIRFDTSKTYHAGDYWLIPARTRTGTIEWPPSEVNVPRLGIEHHYATLAIAMFDGAEWRLRDCRNSFPPLIDVGAGGCCRYVHAGENVQQAVNQIIAAGGGCVVLCPGVHTLPTPLQIDSAHDFHVRGCGWATVVTTASEQLTELITIRDSERITLADMLLTAPTGRTLVNLHHDGANREITVSGCGLIHDSLASRSPTAPSGIRIASTDVIRIERCKIAAPVGIAIPLGDTLPGLEEQPDADSGSLPTSGYADFGDLEPDARFETGSLTSIDGVSLRFSGYLWGNGTVYEEGFASVLGSESYAALHTNNINAVFEPSEPVREARFIYRYDGGNVNVVVNGQPYYAANPEQLHGMTAGGAAVAVQPGQANNYDQGIITIAHADGMSSVGAGGQEFHIAAFGLGGSADALPDAHEFGLPSRTIRIDDCTIRFGRIGVSACIAEDVGIRSTTIESLDAELVSPLTGAHTHAVETSGLNVFNGEPGEAVRAFVEELFSHPVERATGTAILGCIFDGLEIALSNIAAGIGIHAGLLAHGEIVSTNIHGEKYGLVAAWPHSFTCDASTITSPDGEAVLVSGGYRVAFKDCTIAASTGVATLPADVTTMSLKRLVGLTLRSLYSSIGEQQARGLIWLLVEDLIARFDYVEIIETLDTWLRSVLPAMHYPAGALLAIRIEQQLRAKSSSENRREYGWPVAGLTIDSCTFETDKNSVQLTGLISLGALEVKNNRILSRAGKAVLCQSIAYGNSPEIMQSLIVGLLKRSGARLEEYLTEAPHGSMTDLARDVLAVVLRWERFADDTFSTVVAVSGNMIESYRTAIETNFFQTTVRDNHITMRQRPAVFVETTGRINGRVISANGLPAPGAYVYVENAGLGTTAGAEGRFAIADIEPGEVRIAAAVAGYPIARSDTITIQAGEVRDITLIVSSPRMTVPSYGYAVRDIDAERAYMHAFAGNAHLPDNRQIEQLARVLEEHDLLAILAEELREGGSTETRFMAQALQAAIADYTGEEMQSLQTSLESVADVADADTATAAAAVQQALSQNNDTVRPLRAFLQALRKLNDSNGILVRAPGCQIARNYVGVEHTAERVTVARGGIDVSINARDTTLLLIAGSVIFAMLRGNARGEFGGRLARLLAAPEELLETLPRTIIDANEVRGGGGHGIALTGSPLSPEIVHGLSISGNEITDQAGVGIYNNAAAQLVDVAIHDNTLIRCGDDRGFTRIKGGITLNTLAALSVKNNVIRGCAESFAAFGVDISAALDVIVNGNIVEHNGSREQGGGGIHLSAVGGSTAVSDNVCQFNNHYQIVWDGSAGENENPVNDSLYRRLHRKNLAAELHSTAALFCRNILTADSHTPFPLALLRFIPSLNIGENATREGAEKIPAFEITDSRRLSVNQNQITGPSAPSMLIQRINRGIITGNLSTHSIIVDNPAVFMTSVNSPTVV